MKVSEIKADDVVKYARMDASGEDISPEVLLSTAKNYVKSYAGLTDEQMDEHEEISIAVLALCSDMYDNRQMHADNDKINRLIDAIVGMHSRNLL